MMPDFLLSESTIHLFGQVVEGLELTGDLPGDGRTARNLAGARTIARIYAFAFQNEYVELASPALFILRDRGEEAQFTVGSIGLSQVPHQMTGGLTVWKVDYEDLTLRLDVMVGTFSRVLLDYELADTGLQDFVRGSNELGQTPTARRSRRRRWRSDDE
jgi:hypothetical protein